MSGPVASSVKLTLPGSTTANSNRPLAASASTCANRAAASVGSGPTPIPAEGIAYGSEKSSVIVGDLKLLQSRAESYERLFRVGPDRRELGTLEDPQQLDRLRPLLPGEPAAIGEQVGATDEILRHLRSLGYVE